MLKTRGLGVSPAWGRLLDGTDPAIRHQLSRFARWASTKNIGPDEVDDATIDRFMTELHASTLVRDLHTLQGTVARAWNALARLQGPTSGLRLVTVPRAKPAPKRIPWQQLPQSFQEDVEAYCCWATVPDPLAEDARARPLSARSLALQRAHIHSAVAAASAAGISPEKILSLADLVELEVVRVLLRHRWREDGKKLTAYTHGMAVTLSAIAKEWVEVPTEKLAALKSLRSPLGPQPRGLTDKNKALLRRFHDPRLKRNLVELPDKLWHAARRELAQGRRHSFVDLQTALAIDLLLLKPLRMENLTALNFETHFSWPQGRRRPALVCIGGHETKNEEDILFEIPTALAERFLVYRDEIAPAVTGERPDAVFVTSIGKPRTQAAIQVAILRTVQRQLGIRMTPHQFRHLAAKLHLDVNPGALGLVSELLDHKNLETTRRFYAGIDTLRAGRAHAELIMQIRESAMRPGRRRRAPRKRED